MTTFTPVASTIGGILIGISATLMLMLNGRIAGISGILGGALTKKAGDTGWRALFLFGLLVGGALMGRLVPGSIAAPPRSVLATAVAGLLVGVGVAMSGGCTSGHGVCGISRLSKRSIVATLTFMATGVATAVLASRL